MAAGIFFVGYGFSHYSAGLGLAVLRGVLQGKLSDGGLEVHSLVVRLKVFGDWVENGAI